MSQGETLRSHCEQRLALMKNVRTDYEAEAEQIARFAQPAQSRFLRGAKDQNGGRRRLWNRTLFDPHGIEAFRTLTNGMTSGLSSASRQWFTLKLADDALMEAKDVRPWLSGRTSGGGRGAPRADFRRILDRPVRRAGARYALPRLLAATDLGNGDSLLSRLLPPG